MPCCNECGVELVVGSTWTDYRKKTSRYVCKDCSNVFYREYNRKCYNNHSFEQRIRLKVRTTLYNHKKHGHEVIGSIPEYIHTYTGECALCGEEFDIFHEDTHKRGTLDRINNDNVITPDNIQWLCYSCNTGKQDMTNGEYINKLKRIVERYGCE